MKTLVIHPYDPTTLFLSKIYESKGWTVMSHYLHSSLIKENIKSHDRIIMLGHGTGHGLLNGVNTLIGSKYVYLLREKECVCIWCNADIFVEKYKLKGFFTGMIISEDEEANMYCINSTLNEIEESNNLFAEVISKHIEDLDVNKIRKEYDSDTSAVIQFNRNNIFMKKIK